MDAAPPASSPLTPPLTPPSVSAPGAPTPETLLFFPIFADLDLAQREWLVARLQPLVVPARTILLAAGQPGHAVYFLLEGTVKVGLERPTGLRTPKTSRADLQTMASPAASNGAQVMLNLCGPGAVLGELSLVDGLGHSATVEARETCRLLWIGEDDFLQAIDEMPALSRALLRLCSARLRHATHQLHAFATLDAAGRMAHTLLRLGERFGSQTSEGLRLDIGLTQPELADLTGLTRTRVNQVVAQWKKQGLISVQENGEIQVQDMSALPVSI